MMTHTRASQRQKRVTIRRRFRAVVLLTVLAVAGVTTTSCDEPAALAAWHAATQPPAPTTHAEWAALRNCEASGNYEAVSASGKYRGPYQMDRSFWLTYGGDPAYANPPRWEHAPRWMLDRVAYAGYRARGRQPWTSGGRCGYFLST